MNEYIDQKFYLLSRNEYSHEIFQHILKTIFMPSNNSVLAFKWQIIILQTIRLTMPYTRGKICCSKEIKIVCLL